MHVVSALFLLTAAPATAGADSGPAAKPEKEKKICQVETRTGSRLDRGRVCRTASEWEAIRRESADRAKEMQNRTQNPISN